MPRSIASLVHREAPLIHRSTRVDEAVSRLLAAELPALPVVDDADRYLGIFGEREFITALFPGYLSNIGYAAFVPKSVEAAIEKRLGCRAEPVERYMNSEHIDVTADFSDVQLAEIFIHHRVLVIPVTDGGTVSGLVTRSDFFRAIADRLP